MLRTSRISLPLDERLAQNVWHYKTLARLNYTSAYVLTLATIGCSAAAGIESLTQGPPILVAILAFIPAFTALVKTQLKPYGRSQWHFEKSELLSDLYRRLKDQNGDPGAVSAEWTNIDKTMNEKWKGFALEG
jgi:hypothetical protein